MPMNLQASRNGNRINILRQMNDFFPFNLNYSIKVGGGLAPRVTHYLH